MSVSRDFIDFYSPKARDQRRRRGFLYGATDRDCAPITLAIGFRVRHYLGQTLITFGEARCFILALAQESLDRLMQADCFVDFGTGSGAVGAEPDQFLHIRIGRHYL